MSSSNVSQKHVQKLLDVSETKKISLSSKNNKINDIEDTKYRKYITELLNIRIIQDGKIVGVYHLPEEVILRHHSKIVEVYDENGSLTEIYHLAKKNLSWLENTYAHSSEVLLDLHVKT